MQVASELQVQAGSSKPLVAFWGHLNRLCCVFQARLLLARAYSKSWPQLLKQSSHLEDGVSWRVKGSERSLQYALRLGHLYASTGRFTKDGWKRLALLANRSWQAMTHAKQGIELFNATKDWLDARLQIFILSFDPRRTDSRQPSCRYGCGLGYIQI